MWSLSYPIYIQDCSHSPSRMDCPKAESRSSPDTEDVNVTTESWLLRLHVSEPSIISACSTRAPVYPIFVHGEWYHPTRRKGTSWLICAMSVYLTAFTTYQGKSLRAQEKISPVAQSVQTEDIRNCDPGSPGSATHAPCNRQLPSTSAGANTWSCTAV